MNPLPVVIGAFVALVLLVWLALRLAQLPGSRRKDGGCSEPDYEAQAEIEEHDVDQRLDGINERRRRTGRRAIGEELADEAIRGTWGEP